MFYSCAPSKKSMLCMQVLTLSRDAFERLMGPVEEILKEQIAQFERSNLSMSFSMAEPYRRSFV